jgi:CxxC-x17-CxxC domain-containing protein
VYADRTISCVDCGSEFPFTAGEQEFYAQRGFSEAPKRCPSCRARRKSQRQAEGVGGNGGVGSGYGGYQNADGNGGSSGGYGGAYAGYPERREREMFDAVCAECGSPARVPFRPSGVRPVYCSNCFQSRR